MSLEASEMIFHLCMYVAKRYISLPFRSVKNKLYSFFWQVVLGGVIEIVVQHFTDYSFGISVLRSLRLLRIFKFTR